MFIRNVTICLGLFWTAAILDAPAKAETLYVFSASLPVQENAGQDERPLHTLVYGDKVTRTTEEMNTSSQPHQWAIVEIETESNLVTGYARTDTLLPIPTPDLSQSGFTALTKFLTKIGSPKTEPSADITSERQSYEEGVTLTTRTFHTPYGDFEEQTMTVSDITVAQGFLLARAIVNQDGVSSEHMNRTAEIETGEDSRAFVFDESYWQIISVTETPEGVQISFPERAD